MLGHVEDTQQTHGGVEGEATQVGARPFKSPVMRWLTMLLGSLKFSTRFSMPSFIPCGI